MSNLPPTKLNRSNERPKVLIWGLLLSLLLHILVVLFFVFFPQQDRLPVKKQPTTVVRLIDLPEKVKKPQPEEKSIYEIDQQPPKTPPKKPVESIRKAEQDQKVKKEQAPEADDFRDQTMKQPAINRPQQPKPQPEVKPIQPEVRPKQPQKTAPPKKENKQPKNPFKSIRKAKTEPTAKQEKVKETTQPEKIKPVAPPTPPISMEQLMPNSSTLNRITQGSQADRNRRKKREGVEIGDEVWLDTQQDWLASFFQRLSNKIDASWYYPKLAARNGIQGTVKLLIIVKKNGELKDVKLVESSGSDILDMEAMDAVIRAQPFGRITKRYPHDILKIHANFRYKIGGGKYIF